VAARPRPIELYRAPGVQITSEFFMVGGRRFPIGELSYLRTARGQRDPLITRAVCVAAAVFTGIGAALGYAGGIYRLHPASYLTLGVVLLVPVLLAVSGHWLRPPAYELWGRYRGKDLLLFSCDQRHQFGFVTRALVRAREVDRLGATAPPLATRWGPVPGRE
jgi:fatty acid desaturase